MSATNYASRNSCRAKIKQLQGQSRSTVAVILSALICAEFGVQYRHLGWIHSTIFVFHNEGLLVLQNSVWVVEGVVSVTGNHSVPLSDRGFKTWCLLPTQSLRKVYSANFCYVPDKQNHRVVKAGNDLWRVPSRSRSHSTTSSWILISKDGDPTASLAKRVLCSLMEQKIHLLYLHFAEVISEDAKTSKHLLRYMIFFFNFLLLFPEYFLLVDVMVFPICALQRGSSYQFSFLHCTQNYLKWYLQATVVLGLFNSPDNALCRLL